MDHFFDKVIFSASGYTLTVGRLLVVIGILLATRLLIWMIRRLFYRAIGRKGDLGTRYAIYQFVKYILWILAILISLETIGVKITILLAGSAALLVGLGLGLQQTFNDVLSGVILLIEGTVRVQDVIEVEGQIVKVQHIGLRTSIVIDRDDIYIIIPNHILVNDSVINWTRSKMLVRHRITVGVAYGSEPTLVRQVLVEAAMEHPQVYQNKVPIARLVEFGESSLNFELLFWSRNLFRIEQTKSEIRFAILKKFAEKDITIPFPQRDLHIKSSSKPE